MIGVSSLNMSTTFEYRDLMDRQAQGRWTRVVVMEAEGGVALCPASRRRISTPSRVSRGGKANAAYNGAVRLREYPLV